MDDGRGYNRTVRKLLHIAGGAPALALPFIPYWLALSAALAALALALALKPRYAWWLRVISKPRDRLRGVITGLRGYASVVLALVLLWGVLELVSAHIELHGAGMAVRYIMFGWLALAVGDGLAGLLGPGPRKGRTVPWSRTKTWWGFAGCFLGTLLAYFISFGLHFGTAAPDGLLVLIVLGMLTALLIAIIESLDTPVDDNYLVGLGAPIIALLLHLLAP